MEREEILEPYYEHRKGIEDAMSMNIKVDWRTVLQITVNELKEKYKFNIERKNKEWSEAFRKVLSYYMDEKEIEDCL
jgi:hypothetical protein